MPNIIAKSKGASGITSENAQSEGESTTTATTYQTKVTLSLTVGAGDIWDIFWSCEAYNNTNNATTGIIVQNSTDIETISEGVVIMGDNSEPKGYKFHAGFKRQTFTTGGTKSIVIQWRASTGTAYIRRAHILAIKV